jgi:chromosome segregation ATPase
MTKTAEQREKDLKAGVTWVVVTAWEKAISGFEKDLKAPIFLKSGNVGALAGQYDALQSTFNKNIDKKTAAKDGFDDLSKQLDKTVAEVKGLYKELTDISADEAASIKTQDSDAPEDVIAHWENYLKEKQDATKEQKGVFDRWMKRVTDTLKIVADAIAKAKKELAAANAALKSTNDQLNALEKRMRDAVAAYSNTATSMNRQDIASAVRSFLAIFAKA